MSELALTTGRWPGLLVRYRDRLPSLPPDAQPVTLHEGMTPLIRAERIEQALGGDVELYVKFEGLNPTGSFKDRGMTMAVTLAKYRGAKAVICASTGNTSASAAAYAARAGLRCIVVLPKGKIALGKLSQAFIYGAEVVEIDGNFDQALEIVRQLGETGAVAVVNSINPDRIEGQKTIAFEIHEQLGRLPTHHALPVGNAGNITAHWRGYREVAALTGEGLPVMLGFQAEGAAPLVLGHPVDHPETIATAIRIGRPASWDGAIEARDDSGGAIEAVSDWEIFAAQRRLAREAGIFCEPASAAPIAGLLKRAARSPLPPGSVVVATVTGNGLKDPDTAALGAELKPAIPALLGPIRDRLGL